MIVASTWLSGSSGLSSKDIKYLIKKLPIRSQVGAKVKGKTSCFELRGFDVVNVVQFIHDHAVACILNSRQVMNMKPVMIMG